MQVVRLAGGQGAGQQRSTADDHLPAGRDQRIGRHAQARREERAGCPRAGGQQDEQDAASRGLGGAAAREQEQPEAAEPDGDAGERAAVDALMADGRAHDHEPERHRGDEQRGQAGGHVALRDGHEAVAAGRQQQADEARGEQAARRHAHAVPASGEEHEHGDAGDREARAGLQQRWDVLDHHADGDIRPTPEHVDDAKRRPHPPRGRREGVAGAGC